ncbi:MAG TPA: CorA family divalent cation transporter [Kiritimatiellia bacterium]|nr:CorA family divalent cation transporter [Kiritimatiellia bacterium]HMP33861.1 CorA family divalent cation transporter [Kiritimatiellia bacterium]
MQIVAFDFERKVERVVEASRLTAEGPEPGWFYWVVFDPQDQEAGAALLARLEVPEALVGALLGPQVEGRFELHDCAIHFSVTEAWYEAGALRSGTTEYLLMERVLAVMTPGRSPVLEQIQRIYREDFHKFAKSSGFLLYELASRLLDSYRRTFQQFAAEVERIQLTLFGKVTDDIFLSVSRLTADILAFRRMVLVSRDLFNELATRKSAFVAETAQPMLGVHSDRMERLGDELENERSVLAETLNLYMGMVSHRTNKIVNRLTIFSMIFLPLSFLCGVYGMNFEYIPELAWRYGYAGFWGTVVVFIVAFVWFIRKREWI